MLKGDTHALIIAQGRGRGVGFDFTSNTMAVAWDAGGWCLIYQHRRTAGRRADHRRPGGGPGLSRRGRAGRWTCWAAREKQVALRLVFDDPQYPDFHLELWSAERGLRRGEYKAAEAVEEGNRWLARVKSVFRRKLTNGAQRGEPTAARRVPLRSRRAAAPHGAAADPRRRSPGPAVRRRRRRTGRRRRRQWRRALARLEVRIDVGLGPAPGCVTAPRWAGPTVWTYFHSVPEL